MTILPVIKTKRLTLRPLSMADAKDIHHYATKDEVGPRAGWRPHESLRETRQFIQNALSKRHRGQPGIFAVVLNATNRVVGTIGVHSFSEGYKGELGMVLTPELWGQELMVEASEAVMVYAFEMLGLTRLAYKHFPNNSASARLREKLGFTYEGRLRKSFKRFDGQILDEHVASFTDDDYFIRDKARFQAIKKTIDFSL
ncbi:MAG: GNAT family N-acetyltransferase [Bacillota bacterium]